MRMFLAISLGAAAIFIAGPSRALTCTWHTIQLPLQVELDDRNAKLRYTREVADYFRPRDDTFLVYGRFSTQRRSEFPHVAVLRSLIAVNAGEYERDVEGFKELDLSFRYTQLIEFDGQRYVNGNWEDYKTSATVLHFQINDFWASQMPPMDVSVLGSLKRLQTDGPEELVEISASPCPAYVTMTLEEARTLASCMGPAAEYRALEEWLH